MQTLLPAAASTSAQVLRMLADVRPAPDHADTRFLHRREARMNGWTHVPLYGIGRVGRLSQVEHAD